MALKLALIGDGKVGSKVVELLDEDKSGKYAPLTVFNINRPPTLDALKGHDAVISFLPGSVFTQYLSLLQESRLPVITGSTGFEWPAEFEESIKKNQVRWVHGTNFSLGMSLIFSILKILSSAPKLFDAFDCHIHEIHHIHKKDAPSGTALTWKKLVALPGEITSERIGEVIGVHELTLATATEKITLKHEATDRKIFAKGALWAVDQVLTKKNLPYGINRFEELTASYL